MEQTFYTVGYVEDGEVTVVDLIEEWSTTFLPIRFGSAEAVQEDWNKRRPAFKHAPSSKDRVLRITIQVEELTPLT